MKCPKCGEPWIGVPLKTVVEYTAVIYYAAEAELRKCRTCSLVWLQIDTFVPHCCPPHTTEDCRDECDGMCECC